MSQRVPVERLDNVVQFMLHSDLSSVPVDCEVVVVGSRVFGTQLVYHDAVVTFLLVSRSHRQHNLTCGSKHRQGQTLYNYPIFISDHIN